MPIGPASAIGSRCAQDRRACGIFLIAEVYQVYKIARFALSRARLHGEPIQGDITVLTIGDTFPAFTAKAVVSLDRGHEFENLSDQSFEGKWKVYFFWPKDFTFVCPTEIAAFGKLEREFADRDAQLLGASTDSEYVHLAWRQQHPDLRNLPFPMIADLKRELSQALGVLDKREGVALRATFIVDPQGVIRFASVNDLSVGRNPEEVLRVLDALQTDELCPCNWHKGEATLSAA
jgi:peroxiredoxin (alkyl hydroperoxide reductase subunit C)